MTRLVALSELVIMKCIRAHCTSSMDSIIHAVSLQGYVNEYAYITYLL